MAGESNFEMPCVHIFVFLQLLDFLTTVVGFRFGATEASPFIRALMIAGPAAGVALSKVVALGLGAICIWLHKHYLLRWANYWFAGLVTWNLCVILVASSRY
jgi:hypothetical protein